MRRALLAVMCAGLGCSVTTWNRAGEGTKPEGRQVFLVTADRAVVLEDAELATGRVGGHVLQMWQLPPGTTSVPDGDDPSDIARRGGWVEVAPPSFFAADAASMQRIRVTRPSTAGYVAIAAAVVLYTVVDVALIYFTGEALPGPL